MGELNCRNVHICPVLSKTVIFEGDECTEICFEIDCPIVRNDDGGLYECCFYSGQGRK